MERPDLRYCQILQICRTGADIMYTKRIIPCLDINNNRVVKGINFVNLRDAGDPVEVGNGLV